MKVVSVEHVSKKFILRHSRPHNLAEGLRGIFFGGAKEDFWALDDVSFEVEQGEALGIIGHNGAGKSTMLKLLTRIMKPTKGRIRTRGRVSALIEVGAGFHPEMTGRENAYLNGAILGMSRREIDRKLDAIVSFAELERFIDTPVKRYSSGMYVRLGFAIAAHIEPEVMLVDEVLSVGDARFQAKSLERMRGLMSNGTTVVLVSHNLTSVESMCNRTLVFEHGSIVIEGPAAETVAAYRARCVSEMSADGYKSGIRRGNGDITISSFQVLDASGREADEIASGESAILRINYHASVPVEAPDFGFTVYTPHGEVLSNPLTRDYGCSPSLAEGDGRVDYVVDSLVLNPGSYLVSVHAWDATGLIPFDHQEKAYELTVAPPRSTKRPRERVGLISMGGHWVVADHERATSDN